MASENVGLKTVLTNSSKAPIVGITIQTEVSQYENHHMYLRKICRAIPEK
jgi:hypothetical protein